MANQVPQGVKAAPEPRALAELSGPYEVPPAASSISFNAYARDYLLTPETRIARFTERDWVKTLLKNPDVVISAGDERLVEQVIAPYLITFRKLSLADASTKTFNFLKQCARHSRPDKYELDQQCKSVSANQTRPFTIGTARSKLGGTVDFEELEVRILRHEAELGPDRREEAFKQVSLGLERHFGIKTFYELPIAIGDWRAGDRSLRTPDFTVPELRCNGKIVVFDPHEFSEKPKRSIAYDVERWQKLHNATKGHTYLILSSSSTRRELEHKIGCRIDTVADEYWQILNKHAGLSAIKDHVAMNVERLLDREACTVEGEYEGHSVPQAFLDQVTGGMRLLKPQKRA